jgi:hypothetical protein
MSPGKLCSGVGDLYYCVPHVVDLPTDNRMGVLELWVRHAPVRGLDVRDIFLDIAAAVLRRGVDESR